MEKVKVIAELGINHNGNINVAKRLIDGAVDSGVDIVKFQKRTIDLVYSKEELDKYRESPWGTTNREQKYGLEFDVEEYDEIDNYCKSKNMEWMASAWDIPSLKFLRKYDLKYNKIASAMLTNTPFIEEIAKENKYTFISTAMSTLEDIRTVVDIFNKNNCPFELMHCVATYPLDAKNANLKNIATLKNTFDCNVGYSGHEPGLIISCAAVALGATSIERHITLDRTMYGSDQAASLELHGLKKIVNYIRTIEIAMGSEEKKILEEELPIIKKLRYFVK